MNSTGETAWERFLNPEILRTNLIVSSLFITAFEMLKDSIVDRVKEFFSEGFDEDGWIVNSKYKNEVLSLNNSPVYASLEWLRSREVIDASDMDKFDRIRIGRNRLAHEMDKLITKGVGDEPLLQFGNLIDLLNKNEKWWIINVEIPTDPSFDGTEIDEEGILPGRIMILQMLADIALGAKEESELYFKEFIKRKDKK